MGDVGLNKLYLSDLEIWSDEVTKQNASGFLRKMWVGKAVTTKEIRELAKLTLRNAIWCKLKYKHEFCVYFGYDYYMYIETIKECPSASKKVQSNGLYIEDINSIH